MPGICIHLLRRCVGRWVSKTLGPHLLQPLLLFPFSFADRSKVRRLLNAKLFPQVVHVAFELLLPKDIDNLVASRAILQRPRQVYRPESLALLSLHSRHGQHAEPSHGDERVRKLESFEGHLALADDGQTGQRVVEVVALAVALHNVGALLVVDVAHRRAGVRRDALAVEPANVGATDGVVGQSAQARQVDGVGVEARAEAQDTAAGRVGEHGVAEAVDEVGRGGGLAEGSYQVWGRCR